MYQIDSKWSLGGGFEYIEHYNNGVKGVHTQIPGAVEQQLVAKYGNMKDGWDEYVLKTSVAYQMTDDVQIATFFEYTMDDTQSKSQNATNCKMELGVRLNARF